jgi:anti-sigma B factor antagonist
MSTVETPGPGNHPRVVELLGELDIADTGPLATALAEAIKAGPLVIADLTALHFIDCAALGVLVAARAAARRAGGDLILAGPARKIRRVLELTGLARLFPVYADVEQARAAARGSALTVLPARGDDREPPPGGRADDGGNRPA